MPPTTNHKAWVASAVTLLIFVLSRYGVGEAPPIETVEAALRELVYAAVSAGLGWLATWRVPNQPKPPETGATVRSPALLILLMLAFAGALLLSACASQEAERPAQRVYAAQADYNALLAAAVAYESLPRCPQPTACSDPEAVAKIRQADSRAWRALSAAQETVRTPGATDSTIGLALTGATVAIRELSTLLREEGVVR